MKLDLFQNHPENRKLMETIHSVIQNIFSENHCQNDEFVCKCRTVLTLWNQLTNAMPASVVYTNQKDVKYCTFCMQNVHEFVRKRRRNRDPKEFQLAEMSLRSFMRHTKIEWGNFLITGMN